MDLNKKKSQNKTGSNNNLESITLDMEVSRRAVIEGNNNADTKHNLSDKTTKILCENDYKIYDHDKSKQNAISPPYVVWVQFMGTGNSDEGNTLDYDPETRNSFVRKVFLLVLIMLLFTIGFTLIILFVPPINSIFYRMSLYYMIPVLIIVIALNYAMALSQCTRTFPCNYFCLVLVTICMSIFIGYVSVKMRLILILYAALATFAVAFICLLLAFSKFDFTKYLLYIVVIGTALSAIAIIYFVSAMVFKIRMKPVHIGLLVLLTLFQAIMLTTELQMILGGKKVELGVEDYALGAFWLYTSLIDIFLKLLGIANQIDS